MVKRCLDQKITARKFEARNERIETGAPAKGKEKSVSAERQQGQCYQKKKKQKDSAQKVTLVVPVTMTTNVQHQRAHLLQPLNRRRKMMGNTFERKVSQRLESVWEEMSKTTQRQLQW